MKKVNLLLAAVVAASVSAPALAEYTPNAHFFGYMRAGVGFDKNGGYNSKGLGEVANKVGRLGSESDAVFGELGLGTDVAKVGDTIWTVNMMLGMTAGDSDPGNWSSSYGFRQFNVEVKGLFDWDKDALLWMGKRYVQREDIHITDTYYYDISGTGFGLENVSLGSGKWSAAYVKRASDYHVFDTRYNFPLWDGASLQIGNAYTLNKKPADTKASWAVWTPNDKGELPKDADNSVVNTSGWTVANNAGRMYKTKTKSADDVVNGNTFSLEFTQGFNGGWNKTVYMWMEGAAGAQVTVGATEAKGDATAHKIYNFGETSLGGDFHLFHQVDYTYQKFDDKDNKKVLEYRIVLRPWVKLTQMTRAYVELGHYAKSTAKDHAAEHDNERLQKATIAYAITPDAGNFWSRPEMRFFVTWLHADGNNKGGDATFTSGRKDGSTDITVGAQVEAWW